MRAVFADSEFWMLVPERKNKKKKLNCNLLMYTSYNIHHVLNIFFFPNWLTCLSEADCWEKSIDLEGLDFLMKLVDKSKVYPTT
jgi:hypothetical protein